MAAAAHEPLQKVLPPPAGSKYAYGFIFGHPGTRSTAFPGVIPQR